MVLLWAFVCLFFPGGWWGGGMRHDYFVTRLLIETLKLH